MTARLNKQDSQWLQLITNDGKLTDVEQALVEAKFDQETDWDEDVIKKEMAATKKIKKNVPIKIIYLSA